MKRNESFVFYLQHNDPPRSPPEAYPSLIQGEQEVAHACSLVTYYPPFSDNRQGIFGTLYCTTFRLAFVPATEFEGELFRATRLFSSFNYEVPLATIHQILYSASSDPKKLKPMNAYLQHQDQVLFVKLLCKDFRVFTFDFRHCEGSRVLLNGMLRYSFPQKLENITDLLRLLVLPKKKQSSLYSNEFLPYFDLQHDWDVELKRTGASRSCWRVTHVNNGYRYIESYPQFFVVPATLFDSQISASCGNWINCRYPVWCWSSHNGCALLRASTLNTISEVTEKQLRQFECSVQATHPFRLTPITLQLTIPLQEISSAFEALRKLCSTDSGTQFWMSDARWLTELDATNWPDLVCRCVSMTREAVNILSTDRRTVILAENGNCDIACVVSSLVQLCVDPFFRTFHGFAVLIQKEWKALAHPFAARLFGLSVQYRHDDEMAPVFLLFLDCVYQLLVQNPLEFAFTSQYLVALWDLALNGLTRTFLFNNLREMAGCRGGSLLSAWMLETFFTAEYISLFKNPLFAFVTGLEPLAQTAAFCETRNGEREEQLPSESRVAASEPIWPNPSPVAYSFWDTCYLRWLAPAQTLLGGVAQADHRLANVTADISHQLSELRYWCEKLGVDRSRFSQQLRHCRMQAIDMNAAAARRMTSAFPFGWDTIAIPQHHQILPLRADSKQTLSRSTLSLATFDDAPSTAARVAGGVRLSIWGDQSNPPPSMMARQQSVPSAKLTGDSSLAADFKEKLTTRSPSTVSDRGGLVFLRKKKTSVS